MARQSTAAQRNLTLTEELEKLEQSITLTLQEIDHNFSRAHRIVTASILPIVDQYAEHSKNVWEGSKFWKQFFEASANVSLSGYEEPPIEDEIEDESATEEDATAITTPSTSTYASPPHTRDDPTVTPQSNGRTYDSQSFSPSPAQSTPRPTQRQANPSRAKVSAMSSPSPFKSTKHGNGLAPEHSISDSTPPSTPRAQDGSLQGFDEPQSSPFAPPSTSAHTAHKPPANDILLHRVLDKNWRLQATPHSVAKLPFRNGPKVSSQTPRPGTAKKDKSSAPAEDDLDSSPATAAPELHAEIFGSPAKRGRIPGVSVLTPAKGRKEGAGRAEVIEKDTSRPAKRKESLWDSDSEEGEDVGAGMSPPKTMQFHVPQGRLVRTPAREASKRIVEDLLLTAGGNVTDDLDDSPSVVAHRGGLLEEDTF